MQFYFSHTLGTDDLIPVVAGPVAAFILLLILIISIVVVVGVVCRRARHRKTYSPAEREEESERMANFSTTQANEQQESFRLEPYPADERAGDNQYDSVDVPRQGSVGKVKMVRFAGDYCDIDNDNVDALPKAEDSSLCNDQKEKAQQSDQSTGNPNVVYAVVDKSKKKNKGGGATAVQEQEQHYECSDVFGQDWFGNEVGVLSGGSRNEAMKESSLNDAKENVLQSEPSDPSAMYAVVDKSKKRNERKMKKAQKNSSGGDASEANALQKDSERDGSGSVSKGANLSAIGYRGASP